MYKKIECIDHKGNKFDSIKDLCAFWHIAESTYRIRIKNGMSIEDALTKTVRNNSKMCQDHLGNVFKSQTEMCAYWNISLKVFLGRVQAEKWSIEKALTTPVNKVVVDHLGHKFASKKEMCDYWGISYSVYNSRVRRKWTLEKILTNAKKTCKDHLGNSFSSMDAMCLYWKVPCNTYKKRIYEKKWTVEKALLTPVNAVYSRPRYKGFTLIQQIGNTGYYFWKKNSKDYVLSYADIDKGVV